MRNTPLKVVLALAITLSLTSLISSTAAEWLALILIIIAGIPHGSFDLRSAAPLVGHSHYRRIAFLIAYIATGLAMSAACLLWPAGGLAAFLALSALHFIEGERLHSPPLTALLVGAGAILLPIAYHTSSAASYLNFFFTEATLRAASPYLQFLGALVAIALMLALINNYRRGLKTEISQHAICLAAWLLLPPLSGFCVWFIGRHSLQHFALSRTLYLSDSKNKIPLDFIALSLTAIALITPLALRFNLSDLHQLFAASIILIAGLTLPHMIITHLTGYRAKPTR